MADSEARKIKLDKRDSKKRINSLYNIQRKLKEDIRTAYWERNRLVLFLTYVFPSFRGLHEDDPNWDKGWMNIIYIDTPAGQLSWHISDEMFPSFEHLKLVRGKVWDGHTTEEKYRRLEELSNIIKQSEK